MSPRTKTAHSRHCAGLNGPVKGSFATTYGVSEDSSLNKLQHFHVTTGLPPDIMHDLFEGILKCVFSVSFFLFITAVVEFNCMLSAFVQQKKYFSLSTLNMRILNFPYGPPDAVNKPLPLPTTYFSSGSESLKQSCMVLGMTEILLLTLFLYSIASQTWCLIRLLPLMIGDLIPTDSDQNWMNFLRLVKIIEYVCAPATTLAIAGYLEILIDEHHSSFKELYPHRPLTPKFHHMVHYPEWIQRCTVPVKTHKI